MAIIKEGKIAAYRAGAILLMLGLLLGALGSGNAICAVTLSAGENATAVGTNTTAASIKKSDTDRRKGVLSGILCLLTEGGDSGNSGGGGDDTTQIVFNGDTISVSGSGATSDGGTVTITAAGTYTLSGTLADGQLIVDTEDSDPVTLILNGVNMTNSTNAPIFIAGAEETVIFLAQDTVNYVTDAASYVFEDPEEDEPNAAIFSKDDLVIQGSGSLVVSANYNDGIASKDGLTIEGGVINVTSVDDGIRGKDWLVIKDGDITVNAQGDGLKSDEDEDADKGYITVQGGVLSITAGGDGLQAETNVAITAGQVTLTTGGGSDAIIGDDDSAKGIKSAVNVTIEGGTFVISSADDALHSNDSLTITGGTFTIATGDDGIHADVSVTISGGDIAITKSFEGIESALITINGGNYHIVSSDDGINIAGGNDSSATQGPGEEDDFTSSGSDCLYINGGYIVVDASGDGIDANGSIVMSDGVVIINGPTAADNSAIDYDVSFAITGGFLVAAGSAGMAQAPGTTSTQNSLLLTFNTTRTAGTLVNIQTNTGSSSILTFAPSKTYQSVAFSSPELTTGTTYKIYSGGTSTGTVTDGLYEDGTYSPGTLYTTFTVTSTVTKIGSPH